MSGTAVTSQAASDDLEVSGLRFNKEFLSDPWIPGETGTLRFTIDNIHPTDDAMITSFTDDLSGVLSGLSATGPATSDDCGGTLSGTTFLIYVGGSVNAGNSCTIDVPIMVPLIAADGDYNKCLSYTSPRPLD